MCQTLNSLQKLSLILVTTILITYYCYCYCYHYPKFTEEEARALRSYSSFPRLNNLEVIEEGKPTLAGDLYTTMLFHNLGFQRYSSTPLIRSFSYLWSTAVQKFQIKNSRNKQVIRFKICAILYSVMKSHAILPCPTQDVNHSSVQRIQAICISHPLIT